jgi:site-specific DNA recombinase
MDKKIENVKMRYKRKVEAYTAGLIELEDLQDEKQKMESLISSIFKKENSEVNLDDLEKLESKIKEKIINTCNAIDQLPIPDAKALLQTLIEKVTIYGEKEIDIQFCVSS